MGAGRFYPDTSFTAKVVHGSAILTNVSMAGNSDYTHDFDLGVSDRQYGILKMHVPVGAPWSNDRMTASVNFGRELNDAVSDANKEVTYSVYGYLFRDWRMYGFSYVADSKLSDGVFGNTKAVQIKECQIIDDKLRIVFHNTAGSTQLLNLSISFNAWK